VHSDLDYVYDEVGPFERSPPVEVFIYLRAGPELLRGPAGHHTRDL
jgi:hypothetical protein